jgi:hypothetical protein
MAQALFIDRTQSEMGAGRMVRAEARYRLIRRLLVLACTSVSFACGVAPIAQEPVLRPIGLPPLSEEDSIKVATAALVVVASARIASVWSGYWPADQAFVFRPFRGQALLIAPGPPVPVDASALSDRVVPAALRGIAYLYPDSLAVDARHSFDTNYRVGTRSVPAVDLLPVDSTHDRALVLLHYLFHEAFHGYQEASFADRSDALLEPFIDPVVVGAPDFRAFLSVERRLLVETIQARDRNSVVASGTDYLRIRSHRLRMMNDFPHAENVIERKEGSADYAGYRASLLARYGSTDDLQHTLVRNLTDPRFEENVRVAERYRTQLYATGAAIGLILDRLEYKWQQRLAAGEPFPQLLAEAVGVTWPLPDGDIEAPLERFDYPALRARFAEAPTSHLASDFAQYVGPRVIIVDMRLERFISAGDVLTPVPGIRVFMGGDLTIEASGGRVHIRGNTTVEDLRSGRPVLTVHVSELPQVNDMALEDVEVVHDELRIEGPGIAIHLERGGRVVKRQQTLTVYVK